MVMVPSNIILTPWSPLGRLAGEGGVLHHNSRFLKTTAAAATAAQSADRYSGNSNLILRPELVKEDNRENPESVFPLLCIAEVECLCKTFFSEKVEKWGEFWVSGQQAACRGSWAGLTTKSSTGAALALGMFPVNDSCIEIKEAYRQGTTRNDWLMVM